MSYRGFMVLLTVIMSLAVACTGQPRAEPSLPSPTPSTTPTPVERAEPNNTETPVHTPTRASVIRPTPQVVKRATSEQAPQFELTLIDGSSLRLADLRGKVVVLNFWATWCPPCRWEIPSFEQMWREYRESGVVFVGIAVSDYEKAVKEFAQKTGVTYPIGVDATGQIADAYRTMSLPTTFIIDREGNEVRKFGVANEAVLRIFLKGQLDSG